MAVIENHNQDTLANVFSNARNSFYGITGFPTYKFDGILQVEGGGSTSMYGSYVPKVNQRNAVLSDFTINIDFSSLGNNNYEAIITIDNVGGNTTSGLKLQVTITESHLPISWGLSDEVNFVNRLMVPNQNGTVLDFSSGSTQTITLNYTMEGYWVKDNCEIVAFIQAPNKEILQGAKKFMAVPLYNVDAEAKQVVHPEGDFCGNSIEPIVRIKNLGGDNLTNLVIDYSINGGTSLIYNWTGDLSFNLIAEITLPAISFTTQPNNNFLFTLSNPNGQPDPNPVNNSLQQYFTAAPQIPTSTVNFELKTDQYPSETTWKVRNSAGTILYSGGPYTGANTIYTASWQFAENDCYTFTIYDSYGDGICCSYGNGYYKLKDENNVVFSTGGQFGTEETKPFEQAIPNTVTADFSADETSIIEGGSVNFSDLSTGTITSWSWEFEGGSPATSTEQNPAITYFLEGYYDVTLTVSNGVNSNTITKTDYIYVDHLTGIINTDGNSLSLFPNPTSGKVLITGINIQKVLVYNSTGNEVASFESIENNTIDLSHLENGLYLVNLITDDEKTHIKKLTILQ